METTEVIETESTPTTPATVPPTTVYEFQMPRPDHVREMRLFYHPPGTLRATVADSYSYPVVKMFQAAPLSTPGCYLSLVNAKGEEILMANSVNDFPSDTRATVEEEIQRRYLTAKVSNVRNIKTEFGVTYWSVMTDKGARDFVIQSMSESCIWLSDTHILLVDTDGNRFEIADRDALDAESRTKLAMVM